MLNDWSIEQATVAGGMSLQSALINYAAAQPWIARKCFQLRRGKQLGRLDCNGLGNTRIVRETRDPGVRKLDATPGNLSMLSLCALGPDLRLNCARTALIELSPGEMTVTEAARGAANSSTVMVWHQAQGRAENG